MSYIANFVLGLAAAIWLSTFSANAEAPVTAPAANAPVAAIWTWTNQYGSTLAVTNFNASTGQISGTYTNQAAGSCDVGKPQGMTGWLAQGSATAISFTVNWLGCGSTTVWTGQINKASGFQGLWLLSVAAPVAWNGISAGADNETDSGSLIIT
jgi:hypothetical protein